MKVIKLLLKVLVVLLILGGVLLLCGCSSESKTHVDSQKSDEWVMYSSKDLLGGYTVLEKYLFDGTDNDDLPTKLTCMLIIGRTGNTKADRKIVLVSEQLFANCDMGEAFPVVVEREEKK